MKNWILARLDEPSTWASIATGLGGMAGYLAAHGAPSVATYVAAIASGISVVLGVVKAEK